MVQPGIGLDTPQTVAGDTTHLNHHALDFDISQEQSFQSPAKDKNNLIDQLRNARRGNGSGSIKTPRSRAVLIDRRNLPDAIGGGEFTPMLKSATRNSGLRGKENSTPALAKLRALQNIPEDFSPLPEFGSSAYGRSRNGSYISGTPAPQLESSSNASTPMALLPRRNEGRGALQDGNQLSLREQENVIDRVEKENFGLKLKIHFLEDALRKAGPGFSEAALKENTELKVDKVTMQKELYRYRKTLAIAEKDVETYRQHLLEMQEKSKRKQFDSGQLDEMNCLREQLEHKENELDQLKGEEHRYSDLEDKIHDLETDLRERDRQLDSQEDEVDGLKERLERQSTTISDLEEELKKSQHRAIELEQEAQASEELGEAQETIEELERDLRRAKEEAEDAKEERQEALKEKERAEADLEELQDELANKSITTKGLSRQIEEKANRLQDEVEDLKEKCDSLENSHANKVKEAESLTVKVEALKQDGNDQIRKLQKKLDICESEKQAVIRDRTSVKAHQQDLQQVADEKNLLQIRHDALTSESASLQRDLSKAKALIEDLQHKLDHEKTLALSNEREVRDQYKVEIDRLSDKVEDLESEIREKERLYDEDTDKWDSQRRKIDSQREQAEEEAAGLRRTISKLQEAQVSGKESKLQQALQSEKQRHENQEALLTRQINELTDDVHSRSEALDQVRSELSNVREELRLNQRGQKALADTIEGLEDEVQILQASLDDETDRSNQEISAAKQEIEELSSRLKDFETQLSKSRLDSKELKDQHAAINTELHNLRMVRLNLEAQRDDLQSQLDSVEQRDNDTFRGDQEGAELRIVKLKLDNEIRRLREETKLALVSQQALEKEFQNELDRAATEEARLSAEIKDLQRILRSSSEKKELAVAKKTVEKLEARIKDLEQQNTLYEDHDAANELSMMRRDLSTARQKEMDYLQREATHKDALRGLKRQVVELEKKSHEIDVSRLAAASPSPSPRSSVGGSARKTELIEIRSQLSNTQETVKTLRAQLKDALKESARKLRDADSELRGHVEAWESEKDGLERSLDEALLKTEELVSQNKNYEATIKRLREKIDRLEKALRDERQNRGGDQTIVDERLELHEMLREAHLQLETLQSVVQERETTIRTINKSYARLNEYAGRVQDQRNKLRSRDSAQLTTRDSESLALKSQIEQQKRELQLVHNNWELERRQLTQGVRFANMSISDHGDNMDLLKQEIAEKEQYYIKHQSGLKMQVDWWRAKCEREARFRDMGAFAKKYMGLQIEMYESCNKIDLQLLKSMPGVKVTEMAPKRERPTIRKVAHMLRAISRMQAGVREWKKHMEVKKLLLEKIDEVRKQKAIENARAEAQQKVGVSTGSEEDFVTKKMEIRPMLTRMATGDRVEKLVKSRKFSKLTATKSQTTEVTSTLKAHKSKRQPSLLRSASISARVPRSEDEHDISEVLDAEAQLTAPTRDLEMSKIVGAERQQLSNTKENNISKDVRAQFRQAFVTDEYDVSQMLAATSSRKNNPEKEQTAPMTALSKVAQASNTVPVSTQRSEQTSSQPLVDDEDVAKVLDFAPAIQPATKTSRHHFQELKQSEKHSSLTQEKRRLLKKLVSAAASTHRASQPVDREEAQSPAKDARALHFVSQSHGADAAADTTAQSGQMMDAETQEFTQEFAFKIEALIKSGGSMGKMPRLDAFSFATQPQKRSKPSRKSAPAQSEVQHIVSSSSSMDPKIQFEIKPSHPSKHSEAQPEVQASAPTSKQPDVQPELAPSTRDSTQNDSQFQIEPATPAHTQTQPQTQTHDEIQESPQPSRRADTQAEMQTQTQTLTGIQPSEIDDTMMLDLDGNTTFIERCAAMGVRAEDLISIQTAMTEDHTVHTQPDSSPDVTIQSVQSRDQTIETQPEITTLRAETRKMRKTSEKSRGSMSTGGYSELARMIAMRKASEAGYGDGGMMSPRKLNGVVRKE